MSYPRSLLAITAAVILFFSTTLVQAQESTSEPHEGSAAAIVVDAFILRPAGFIGTVMGAVTFVVTLPFSAPTRTVDNTAKKLVVEPAKFTFTRPLGQMPKDPN
jgi:hypothetical protein